MKQKHKVWIRGITGTENNKGKGMQPRVHRPSTCAIYQRKGKFLANPGSDDSWLGQVRDNTEREKNDLTFIAYL